VLRYGVSARAFADADLLGVATNKLAYTLGHQMVVEHHVRILEYLQATKRQ